MKQTHNIESKYYNEEDKIKKYIKTLNLKKSWNRSNNIGKKYNNIKNTIMSIYGLIHSKDDMI